MRLPTFKPNDIDYARLMREWELLDDRNKVLERENAALREQVEHLIGMIEQLEVDLAHFATIEAFEGKKEAQP